jgi:hypothetical protein
MSFYKFIDKCQFKVGDVVTVEAEGRLARAKVVSVPSRERRINADPLLPMFSLWIDSAGRPIDATACLTALNAQLEQTDKQERQAESEALRAELWPERDQQDEAAAILQELVLVGRPPSAFLKELQNLINRQSVDACIDAPDTVIAEFLGKMLVIYARAVDLQKRGHLQSFPSTGDCVDFREALGAALHARMINRTGI